MKDDPFASLSGLDQRLFQDDHPKETTKQRDNETTLSTTNEPASVAPKQDRQELSREPDKQVASVHANEAVDPPELPAANHAPQTAVIEATRTPVSVAMGQRWDARVIERHSHDIFYDQIRWMNHLKLDIEELYGVKVTCNGMVQVAVDVIRQDYEANGEDSNLMRQLVFGKPLRGHTSKGKQKGAAD